VSAFTNCGRAVAHVRGSCVPEPDDPSESTFDPSVQLTDDRSGPAVGSISLYVRPMSASIDSFCNRPAFNQCWDAVAVLA
jgi:hypothetical protein